MDRWRALAGPYEQALIVVAPVLTVVPLQVDGSVHGWGEGVGATCTVGGALSLALWRRHPIAVLVGGPLLVVVCAVTGPDPTTSCCRC